ncbi:MAG: WhiB family transcriptional regulator [Bifidobacteriaceae bacterium]|jgi:WhiB family redox-sensing transcriptional regulator|nr:WhiB family transcriptional regulator [Bifidobacteriaceae bacterium]
MGWRKDCACKNYDANMFFPMGTTYLSETQETEAVSICKTECSVIDRCLRYAIENGESRGIWGGKTERERKELRRELRLTRR